MKKLSSVIISVSLVSIGFFTSSCSDQDYDDLERQVIQYETGTTVGENGDPDCKGSDCNS